jgi:putative transposase
MAVAGVGRPNPASSPRQILIILGWRAATSMHTALVLDCLEQAIWTRRQEGTTDLSGLIHHTEAFNEQLLFLQQAGVASTG